MKKSPMPRRKSGLPRARFIKRKPRSKVEAERIYGVDARTKWMRNMPCLGCARIGTDERPHHLHHVTNGGMGRKASADLTVPLCCSCHSELHGLRGGVKTFERIHGAMLCYRTLESWAGTYATAWSKWEAEC